MSGESDPTSRARESLLNALDALGDHSSSLVIVGAQAIYLRVGEAYTSVAPFTTDGDLMLDPLFLADVPDIGALMTGAGFHLAANDVGVWESEAGSATIDLLVPATVGGPGRRGARLGNHGNRVAKKVPGLEGALVDRDLMAVEPVGLSHSRTLEALVAGPAALLASKLYKLSDRQDQPRRLDNKDALDVFRLMQGTALEDFGSRFEKVLTDPKSAEVGDRSLGLLLELFGSADSAGAKMAADAVAGLDDVEFVATASAALAQEILGVLGR